MADGWRDEILCGVSTVKVRGIPGVILAYGKDAVPILTDRHGGILIAASCLGKGRVVVFSHDGYTVDCLQTPTPDPRLIENIKKWVSRGTYSQANQILDWDKYVNWNDISSACKILVWVGMKEKSADCLAKLYTWVETGGSLICGATPWGFLQIYASKTLDQLPLNFILRKIGMAYTDGYLWQAHETGVLCVSENQAEHANLHQALAKAKDDIQYLEPCATNIANALGHLPDCGVDDLMPDITSIIQHYAKTMHTVPTKSFPISIPQGKILASLMCRIFIRTGQYNGSNVAEGITEFPGQFDSAGYLPETVTQKISCDGYPSKYHPTGHYLPAGAHMTVFSSQNSSKPWKVVIGCHSDELYGVQEEWRRWPHVQIVKELCSSPLVVSSPFGGLVYIQSPDGICATLEYTLHNVVPAPRFMLGTTEDWDTQKNNPGLWADISGNLITITLPSSSIRSLPDPAEVVHLWDQVVQAHVDLRGHDPYKGRGQWVVADEQPCAGYMHTGYPLITHLDVADPNKVGIHKYDIHTVNKDGGCSGLGPTL